MDAKDFIDKKLGIKGHTHSPLTLSREEIYLWLEEFGKLQNTALNSEYKQCQVCKSNWIVRNMCKVCGAVKI